MRRLRATLIAIACAASSACGKSTPAPQPPTVSPGDPVPVTGQKNLAWDQSAANLDELSGVGYNLYVDGNPTKFESVPCGAGQAAGTFVCQLPLPSMIAGPHSLQLTSFYLATPTVESAKSAALQIVVTAIVAGGETALTPQRTSASAPSDAGNATWPSGLVRVADGLDRPSDLAFTPDGRLWIAERSGRVRVMHEDGLVAEPALTMDPRVPGSAVLSVAPDPHFTGNHFVFAIYTERSRAGNLTFAIARFREVRDTLADRVVILDDVPASSDPHASLRFGLDGKLYAAFDDADDARLPDDPASFNGKTLRLNPDGTTPDDAPTKSPVFSAGLSSPRGLAWHRATSRLWAADASTVGRVRWTPAPEGIAILEDNLFVASQAGLARAQLQGSGAPQLGAPRDVIRGVALRAIAVAPDGAVYVATDTAIGRFSVDVPH